MGSGISMAEVCRHQNYRVGIVLATYNCDRAHFMAQIQSIQQQDFQNWCCLVTDDGSTEPIRQFIQQAIAGDSRFIYHPQPRNLGSYHNFEYGLKYFSQDDRITHVAFADQDDIWRPDKLTQLLKTLELSGALLAHSDLSLIDAAGHLLQPSVWEYEKRHPEQLDAELLLLRNTVTGCTVMIDRTLMPIALPFPKQQIVGGWYHDHWLALVAAQCGKIAHIREPLVQYRQHDNNVVGTQKAVGTFQQELQTWVAKKGKLGLRSYRIHRDLSQAFYQRFYPDSDVDTRNPFADRNVNFGWPILKLGIRSSWQGYGVAGVTVRLLVNKIMFDLEKLKDLFSKSLFGLGGK